MSPEIDAPVGSFDDLRMHFRLRLDPHVGLARDHVHVAEGLHRVGAGVIDGDRRPFAVIVQADINPPVRRGQTGRVVRVPDKGVGKRS